ncbi:MAG: MOP flippase family protein [Alphaproteobacteria bacterium]|nr:MOP flippase family protein [Alphaproteobacteria bacterium]MDE2496159.1 MOP flippase family protein [Alphaproteobacteria bacterium]
MNLRNQVIHGLSWSFIARFGSQLCQLVVSITLARMLTPNEFGIIGMLLVFTGFAQSFSDFGLGSALIYYQNVTEVHRSSAFWLQLGVGVFLTVLFYVLAPFIADFYSLPILTRLARLLSCVFFFQAVGQTHSALFAKEFRFKALAISNVGAATGSGIIAVIVAHAGYGVWALAWQPVVSAVTLAFLLSLQSPWRPRLMFNWAAASELWRYGSYLMGHGSLNYWLRNGDNLLIGKVLGAHALGVYARAYSLMLLPLTNIGSAVGQVMFPALSQLQNDVAKFRYQYLAATRGIALVSFPLMAGVAALARPLILFLLGDKWAEVVPILQILSLVGLFQSIIFPVGWIFTALGKTKAQFHLSIVLGIAFAAAMFMGIQHGVLGVTYAYAAWTLLSGLLNLRLVGLYIKTSVTAMLLAVAPIAVLAGVMGFFVYSCDATIFAAWPLAARLAIGLALGVASFFTLCAVTKDETFQQLSQLIYERL